MLSTDDSPLVRAERDKLQADGLYGWRVVNRWRFERNHREALFFAARLPMLLAAAWLGLLIFAWARDLYGIGAGFAALVLFVFDPNMLAPGPLVHTDMAIALTIFGASYFYWRAMREMIWFNGAMTLLFVAAAALSKFSFIILPLVWGLLAIGKILSPQPRRRRRRTDHRRGRQARLAGGVLPVPRVAAYAAIWNAYGWRYDAVSGQGMPLNHQPWCRSHLVA